MDGVRRTAESRNPSALCPGGCRYVCVFIILGKETEGEKSCTAQLFTEGRQSQEDSGEQQCVLWTVRDKTQALLSCSALCQQVPYSTSMCLNFMETSGVKSLQVRVPIAMRHYREETAGEVRDPKI